MVRKHILYYLYLRPVHTGTITSRTYPQRFFYVFRRDDPSERANLLPDIDAA